MPVRRILCVSTHQTTLAILADSIQTAGHEAVIRAEHEISTILADIHAAVIDCETAVGANIVSVIRGICPGLTVIGIGEKPTEGVDLLVPASSLYLLGNLISAMVPEPE